MKKFWSVTWDLVQRLDDALDASAARDIRDVCDVCDVCDICDECDAGGWWRNLATQVMATLWAAVVAQRKSRRLQSKTFEVVGLIPR